MLRSSSDVGLFRLGVLLFLCGSTLAQPTGGTDRTSSCESTTAELLQEIRASREDLSKKNSDDTSLISQECPICSFKYFPEGRKCYRLETNKMTWSAARKKCHDLHPRSHPVVINDVDEQNLIMKYLNSIKRAIDKKCYFEPHFIVWTAGQRIMDTAPNSPFVWKPFNDRWNPMNFDAWQPGKPNSANSNESCVHIDKRVGSMEGMWNDNSCDITVCVLCEIDIN